MLMRNRWLLSIVLCVTLSVTMLWTPAFAAAADNSGGQQTAETYINSDGSAAFMANGFAYRYINGEGERYPDGVKPDGTDVFVQIIGYYGKSTKVDIPEKIDGYDVTQVRWSNCQSSKVPGEIDYDSITDISIPSTVSRYDRLESDSQESFEVKGHNDYYRAINGVLYENYEANGETFRIYEYPAAKGDEKYEVPNGVETLCLWELSGRPIKELSIPASVEDIYFFDEDPVDYSTLEAIEVDKNNKNYISRDGILYKKTEKEYAYSIDGGWNWDYILLDNGY